MANKYKNPVGSNAYHVERQRAYEKRRLAQRQIPLWLALIDRVITLDRQCRTYQEIAEQLVKDEEFLIKERRTK